MVAASPLAAIGLAPRGLSREQAAAYVGVGVVTWDAMVADGRMPQPAPIRTDAAAATRGRLVWDRLEIDAAFAALPRRGTPTSTQHHADDDTRWETRV